MIKINTEPELFCHYKIPIVQFSVGLVFEEISVTLLFFLPFLISKYSSVYRIFEFLEHHN